MMRGQSNANSSGYKVIRIKSRFQVEAAKPGGIKLNDAVKAAGRALDELKPRTLAEIDAAIAVVSEWFDAPPGSPRPEKLESAIATLCDTCALADLPLLGVFAEQLYDVLHASAEGGTFSKAQRAAFAKAFAFARAFNDPDASRDEFKELVSELESLVIKVQASAAAD